MGKSCLKPTEDSRESPESRPDGSRARERLKLRWCGDVVTAFRRLWECG